MGSKFIMALLPSLLADRVPFFAYWLFYSEMTVALVLSLAALLQLEPLGFVALVYAAFCFCGAETYRKRRAEQQGKKWVPSRVALASNYLVQATTGFLSLFLLFGAERAEGLGLVLLLIALMIGMLCWSAYGIWTLSKGRWPDWP